MQQKYDIIQNIVVCNISAHYIGEGNFVLKSTVFNGLTDSEAKKLARNIKAKKEKCNINEIIMSYNFNSGIVGIILSGEAELVCYDYDGNKILLEQYENGDIFGPSFATLSGIDEPQVVATKKCEVLFFDYKKALAYCLGNGETYIPFIHNILGCIENNTRKRASRIEVLTKRSLRAKLMAYFESQVKEKDLLSFTLPFSLYTLADYLSVDRSAMQREMKKLRDEGIITSKGKKIELLRRL